MANPQPDQFVRLSTELLEAMSQADMSGSEFRVFLAVIRKTYGHQKKTDQISISQLSEATGLSRRGVCKATTSLVNKMALGREQNGTTSITTYWIQKDYDKWALTSEQNGTSEQLFTRSSEQLGIQLVNKTAPTIDNIQKKERKSFDFESLWLSYPKRDGKKDALRHFNASVKTEEDFINIKKALGNYLLSDTVKNGFIKNGSTWFNNWRDWIDNSIITTKTPELEKALKNNPWNL